MKRIFAFTLAEILTTLTLIGVVAAFTIPSLIMSNEKQRTIAAIKTNYSAFQRAVELSEVDNGPTSVWNFNYTYGAFWDKYLAPYMHIVNTTTYPNVYPNGTLSPDGKNKETLLALSRYNGFVVTLANGTNVLFPGNDRTANYWGNNSFAFGFDINGSKGPNKWGRDLFCATIYSEGIVPWGQNNTVDGPFGELTRNNILNVSSQNYQCKKDKRGMHCLALIILDGWKIADDYPW